VLSLAVTAAVAFASGAAFDLLNVQMIRSVGRGRAGAAAAYSAAVGACGLTGLLESVHDWRAAPFLLLGYYVGTYVAVRLAR
jgi:hypothetical protein